MNQKRKAKAASGKTIRTSLSSSDAQVQRSIDILTESRDPALIEKTVRENWERTLKEQRPMSMSRAYAELVKLLDGPGVFKDETDWKKAKFYVALLRGHFLLPRVYSFYPRNSVPTGAKGYNEDYYSKTFKTPHEGQSVAPGATGYGAFNPNTGFFQAVGVSTGNQVAVMVGPTVTVETDAPVDAAILAQTLVDYQYTVSSSVNPAFVPSPYSGAGLVDVEIGLTTKVSCIDKTTHAPVPPPSGPWGYSQLRSLTVDFNLQRIPFTTASGHEIRVGRSDQGSAIALPITFQPDVQLPGNSMCDISIVAFIQSSASGGQGQKEWMFLGFGDVRAFGQFLSIEVDLY